jgi:endonuclease/exonuclease/phosphatase family metal-dependent hydrolase
VRAVTWNLFHGRDNPPEPGLFTWRSRLLGLTERGVAYAQVNRSLLAEFTRVLERDPWSVALLQEAPPRWLVPLEAGTDSHGASALTSRNFGGRVRGALADHNPDLIASNEGGSNQILVRPPWRIDEVRRLTLTERHERRRLIWVRLVEPGGGHLAVGNLHASVAGEGDPIADVELAAERSVEWAGGDPLILGGDLNVRPARDGGLFARLESRFGLAPPTARGEIDHLLSRELELIERPRELEPAWRELPGPGGLLLRLSDHGPVVATLGVR